MSIQSPNLPASPTVSELLGHALVGGQPRTVRIAIADLMSAIVAGSDMSALATGRLGATATAIGDANAATDNGFWALAADGTHGPVAGAAALIEVVGTAGYLTQTAHCYLVDTASDPQMWRRDRNGGTWSAWYRLHWSETELDARYARATSGSGAVVPRGHIWGLETAYVSANTISIAAGEAANEDAGAAVTISVAGMTKTLAPWSIGNRNGMLDSGTVLASTTYHIFAVRRDTDGLGDVVGSTSLTPVLPTGWSAHRRIWSIRTNAASEIVPYVQARDRCLLQTPPIDVSNTTLAATAVLYALSVPTGLTVEADIGVFMDAGGGNTIGVLISSPLVPDIAAGSPVGTPAAPYNAGNAGAYPCITKLLIPTNTSAQVRARADRASGNRFQIYTFGWTDRRGQ